MIDFLRVILLNFYKCYYVVRDKERVKKVNLGIFSFSGRGYLIGVF